MSILYSKYYYFQRAAEPTLYIIRSLIYFLFISYCINCSLQAQWKIQPPSPKQVWNLGQNTAFQSIDTIKALKDTMEISGKDTLAKPVFDSVPPPKSTAKAMILSAILPGAGQIYTGRYWKIPIIWGFSAWLGSQWIQANKYYLESSDAFKLSVANGENNGQGNELYLFRRDYYRDVRDKAIFYFFVVYLLNIVDAYVGSQLFDFDVTDNLGPSAKLRISIPIR